MSDDQLHVSGSITHALLDALDEIHTGVTASLTNPDGSPSGTAVYMHLPVGRPIDPKMYANPWTPAGGSGYSAIGDDGKFATPTPTAAPADGAVTPAGQLAAMTAPGATLQSAINSAFNTSQLVDDMLMVTDRGVAISWPDRTVSGAYSAILAGMQAEPVPEPSADTKARIAAAEKALYLMDAEGNYTGYTPLHVTYRHNQKALADARSAHALAYTQAMADPVAGQHWPVTSRPFQNAVDQANDDLKNMGGRRVEEAIATLQSIGGSAAASLIAKARKMYDEYSVGLSGAIAATVPWSYIDPVSWWDHNNKDIGATDISIMSATGQTSRKGSDSSFSHRLYRDKSSSKSGKAGFTFSLTLSANAARSTSKHDESSSQSSSTDSAVRDSSTSATVTFEWFLASIECPGRLGDLFHMQGWYLTGGKKDSISDGSITGQIDRPDRLLPMIPKGFIVVRNVRIKTDSWGTMESEFRRAADEANGHTDTGSTSYGGSIGWLGLGGSAKYTDTTTGGNSTSEADNSHGWSYTKDARGGTLELRGAQIVGWIGQIQPASPYRDDPALSTNGQSAGTAPTAPSTVTPSAPAPAGG